MNPKIKEIAKIDELEYQQRRGELAQELGIGVGPLDRMVKRARQEMGQTGPELVDPDPWPEPVDGDDLLDQITTALRRYLVLPDGGAEILALWALHCHCYHLFSHSPRLHITAPERGCGKSRVIEVLRPLVPRAVKADNLSAAVCFRLVETYGPTLLIDEIDRFLSGKEELIGILNSEYESSGQTWRCEGDRMEMKCFRTFAPVALGGIGRMADTLEDRSIRLEMQRKRPEEKIARFRSDRADDLQDLARMAARWTKDHELFLTDADPHIPESLPDRPADNWRSLFALADAAGGDWPDRARALAARLTSRAQDTENSVGIMLLSDLRAIFDSSGEAALPSIRVVERLHELEDRPWPEFGRSGKPISQNTLARLLKRYDIKSKKRRFGSESLWGYALSDFSDQWSRLLPPSEPEQRNNPQESAKNPVPIGKPVPEQGPELERENSQKTAICSVVPCLQGGRRQGVCDGADETPGESIDKVDLGEQRAVYGLPPLEEPGP